MSDSYTAWCEQQEQNACMFSKENVKDVKKTKEFEKLLKQAKAACESNILCGAKSCQNCMHRTRLNSNEVCKKLGIILKDIDLVCKKWRGTPCTHSQPKTNEDIIAWSIIQKHRFEY